MIFTFGESDAEHLVGNSECDACWSTPVELHECGQPDCLEHTSFGDENANGDYWLFHCGDICREP